MFEIETEAPTLMFFYLSGNTPETYVGPHDMSSLIEFINEKTDRLPPSEKVLPY